jgi:DNA-binding transcriptional regulator YbjK
VEAALTVIARVGPDGLTHRLVAAEAGVPLAATTYWFSSKEEIVGAAVVQAADDDVAHLDDLRARAAHWTADTAAAGLAQVVDEACTDRRETSVLGYALWVEALRRPALRPLAQRWIDAYLECFSDVLRTLGATDDVRSAAQLVTATVDGLVAQQLAAAEPLDRPALAAILARVLDACLAHGEPA